MELESSDLIAEAERCEAYAKKLREAVAIRGGSQAKATPPTRAPIAPAKEKRVAKSNEPPSPGEREIQVVEYLKSNPQPKTIAEIFRGLGLPRGTVRSVLKRGKDKFEKDRQKRWRLISPPAKPSTPAKQE